MKLKRFQEQIDFCTKDLTEEQKDNMQVCVELEGGIVPRRISFVEGTESTLYIVSRAAQGDTVKTSINRPYVDLRQRRRRAAGCL